MKNILFILCLILIVSNSYSQDLKENEVPEAVRTNFFSLYPESVNAVWEKDGDNFEASFTDNNIETSLIYDVNGKLLYREEEIPLNMLPENIINYLSEYLDSDKINIDEAGMITNEFGVITLKAEIKGIDYLFDVEGNFIYKESDIDNFEDDHNNK